MITGKYGMLARKKLKKYRELSPCLIKLQKSRYQTLMNIFNNFIPNKTSKLDFKKLVWMNKETVSYLKKNIKTS